MYAGALVYEALYAAGTKPADRVELGGLRHMAIMFARAMGCGVSALFSSPREPSNKINDVISMGADEVFSISSHFPRTRYFPQYGLIYEDHLGAIPIEKIDVLLVTSNELPDWATVLDWATVHKILQPMARIVLTSITQEPLRIPAWPSILLGHRMISSTEASKRNHMEMLEFAARNNI